jgi:Outer membrane protein beta-barrel domain
MTHARIFEHLVTVTVGAFALLGAPMASRAAAQDRPGLAVDFSAGWVGFADDGIVSEGLIGGAARWYLLPRISVGPEFTYISGDNHSHLLVTGNVTFDLLAPASGARRRVTPFVVAGGGLFQTSEQFFSGTFTSHEGTFTAGGGVRTFVSDRVTIGIDARVGWELHVRVNGLVGLQLGR